MKLIIFILLFILPLYTAETSTDLAVLFQHGIRKKEPMSNKQLYEHCDIKVISTKKDVIPVLDYLDPENSITNGHTNWIPASSAGMTGEDFEVTESNHDRRLLFMSSTIKSSFFATGIEQGLAPNTVVKLINIYKDFGVDFKKDIVPKSKSEVLFERSLGNQKTKEKILYASLTINKKAISLYHYKSQDGKERYFNKEGISLKNGEIFANPLNGDYRISSKFGNRKHPVRGKIAFHKGVDYAAKLGTPIYAAAEGVVEYIGKNGGYGNYIKIKHKNEYSTCYAHISRFSGDIKLGSKVKQGQVIAYVGSTGVATGPHLHYEVIYNGKHIDPLTIAHKTEVKLPDHELREFKLFVNKINKTINREGSSEKEV
ncbi:peptidoglycan DD-metalloendopeptidase family protein [Wolbachia pipientis]|uniref:Peptidoglycan DD-metalloendopeptidase family protein n=1 Tax=Wolbachia pipientis TaxID=955 RepID=A0A6C1U6U4_WOLPI|nr:peptidoglycan DD-metalloendopeptidase family protein [Wolbachia endosymbiont of Aedes albopictus]TVS90230.1 peptidoglycan DD-metalloendopeptidase family protein [Wolbachia pipientis]TVS98605.1 peptidoglycan DD-metalloendopeptidase family protein [Wolbachia pipientis]UVW84461.1 peptidoglycan DD-metalloendopeptidase family protein [Wolbachia endosymbiont of Aedes albopictus]